jgi:hypothetical protein
LDGFVDGYPLRKEVRGVELGDDGKLGPGLALESTQDFTDDAQAVRESRRIILAAVVWGERKLLKR